MRFWYNNFIHQNKKKEKLRSHILPKSYKTDACFKQQQQQKKNRKKNWMEQVAPWEYFYMIIV